jgi:hypothetical protein
MGKLFRLSRAMKYTLLFAAAVISFISPSSIVLGGVGSVVAIIWSLSLGLGSAISLWGTLGKNWVGEFVGLPAIIAPLLLYGILLIIGGGGGDAFTLVRLFVGMIFVGFSFSTLARRSDVKFQKMLADYENRKKNGKVGL